MLGGIGVAALLMLQAFMKKKQEVSGGTTSGEIEAESTITVEPIT